MTTKPASFPGTMKIACLDVLAPAVQAQARAIAAPDFEIRFAATTDLAERYEIVADADFIMLGVTPVTAELLEHCPKVRLIQSIGVGLDAMDIDAVRRSGIALAKNYGGNAAPVSELVLALAMAVNRRMMYADRKTREGVWVTPEMRSSCLQIDGLTFGLLGLGAIAKMVAKRLAGFEVDILYHSRNRADLETEKALRLRYVGQDELLAQSDILSLHVPLNSATRHMIDAKVLGKMKPDAVLINTSRGAVVDEAALYEALASGRLRGAGLDVFSNEPPQANHPLFTLDNVVVMPHAGGAAFNNVNRVMHRVMGNMRKVRDGQELSSLDLVVPARGA